jgi:putative DNA primase/helicase
MNDEHPFDRTKPRKPTASPSSNQGASPSPRGRPVIVIMPGETERVVDEIEAALIASGRPLYKRGGLVVEPGVDKQPTWNGEKITVQAIVEVSAETLAEYAETAAQFRKPNKEGDLVPCGCRARLATTLKKRLHRLKFPVLAAVVNTPSISIDGVLLDCPGYDPETGVLFDPLDAVFPCVPDLPTDGEIRAAVERVLQLFETFDDDFATPADKGVALSMLMTSIARRALGFAPLHGFDAPVAGSGKSMLVEIASIVAAGHGAIVMAQGETREEFEKRLGTVLMRGDAIIAIDNCDLPLEGETLNQALTQPMLQVRILGKSEMPKVLTAAVVCATGNNLLPKGDVVRRSIICRLDPKCARPELRQYDFKPIAYAKENRAQLVVDILTLLKAWHNKGRPFQPAELQSFENWSNTIRGCIIWLGAAFPDANLADPCLTMDRIRASDPVLTNLRVVLSAWRDQFGDEPKTSADVILAADGTKLKPRYSDDEGPREREPLNPELRSALLLVANRAGKIDVRALGIWLGKSVDRRVGVGDGRSLRVIKAGEDHSGAQRWKVTEN